MHRWNKLRIGLIVGLLLPILIFAGYYLIWYSQISLGEFLQTSVRMKALPKILSLCVFPNLAIFYFFLNREYWYSARGVIIATLLCAVGVIILKIFE
jgi:hypothetical protein